MKFKCPSLFHPHILILVVYIFLFPCGCLRLGLLLSGTLCQGIWAISFVRLQTLTPTSFIYQYI